MFGTSPVGFPSSSSAPTRRYTPASTSAWLYSRVSGREKSRRGGRGGGKPASTSAWAARSAAQAPRPRRKKGGEGGRGGGRAPQRRAEGSEGEQDLVTPPPPPTFPPTDRPTVWGAGPGNARRCGRRARSAGGRGAPSGRRGRAAGRGRGWRPWPVKSPTLAAAAHRQGTLGVPPRVGASVGGGGAALKASANANTGSLESGPSLRSSPDASLEPERVRSTRTGATSSSSM